MCKRFMLLLSLFLAASPTLAQIGISPAPATAQTQAAATPKPATVNVTLQTSEGTIRLELESASAPVTTKNFLRYVDQKRLDGTTFYRGTKVGPDFGLIQGGVRNDPKRLLPPIAHEPTTKTRLSHVDGAISMARNAPGTATADFFITVGAMPSMDADPRQAGDNQGFAVFGRVTEGMDVVRRILDSPKSPTAGEGVMKGHMLAPPVRIVSTRRDAK